MVGVVRMISRTGRSDIVFSWGPCCKGNSRDPNWFRPTEIPLLGITTMSLETWELLSYVVTVVGLPLAIGVFLFEQRKERENEEEEVYQLLSDNYQDFLKVALANPDLRLFSPEATPSLAEEQPERLSIIFEMLISLFARA